MAACLFALSFTGFFRNKALGKHRAFVADPHRTVIAAFPYTHRRGFTVSTRSLFMMFVSQVMPSNHTRCEPTIAFTVAIVASRGAGSLSRSFK